MKEMIDALGRREVPIAVVGLGYVGLPLAAKLGVFFRVQGFDIDARRIAQLRDGLDVTGEVESAQLATSDLDFSSDPASLAGASFIIVTVPTPISSDKKPDLGPLIKASRTIGTHIRAGAIVVFESTVFPGATEEVCGPIIEETSGMQAGRDFFLGYSPERINPGDKVHTVDKIVKVISAQNESVLAVLDYVYGSIVTAGIHRAPDIRTAEAAKVIENTQRDLNIAFVNELAMICHRLGLDTHAVLAAAGTKWNFLPFQPGLVGGHCIGVDPYYLIHKARQVGYEPQVILAGRQINDGMGKYVATRAVKETIKAGHKIQGARALVLGLTFKENVPDTRNAKVADIIDELREYGVRISVHDPLAQEDEDFGATRLQELAGAGPFELIVLAVAHRAYLALSPRALAELATRNPVFVDVKAAFDRQAMNALGFVYWSL